MHYEQFKDNNIIVHPGYVRLRPFFFPRSAALQMNIRRKRRQADLTR